MGDAGCHTGFARVTHSIGERLVADYGHEVSVLAVNYLGDWWPTSLRLYRANKLAPLDVYGQSRIVEMLAEVMPEAIVMLNDPVPIVKILFNNKNDPDRLLLRGGALEAPILAYIPIDGYHYPAPVMDVLAKATTRIAMTQFGQRAMPGSRLVYHGVDTDTYRPVSKSSPMTSSTGITVTSKGEAKAAFGYSPDSFLILRVDRNSFRKGYPDTWRALVPVMKRHDDILVHFHCQARDDYDLNQLISREPEIAKRIRFPGGLNTFMGWPEEDLAILYNAADLFVTTSWGEGFGLTVAEAIATGIPVVAQDVSAISEVVGPGGILLQPDRLTAIPKGHDQWLPDVGSFERAIERLYDAGGSRRKLGEAGRRHAVEHFSWDASTAVMESVIRERTGNGLEISAGPGPDPGSDVQHRDQGDDGQGGPGGAADPALHGVLNN
jgi:glycosyltransferase involved in cell wall biosynthesis